MSIGLCDQIERKYQFLFKKHSWSESRNSHKWDKTKKHRRERYRAKKDPNCLPQYRRYAGWEW